MEQPYPIKVIIGLGNPGLNYYYTRHSIGFRVVDELAKKYAGNWKTQGNAMYASIMINDRPVTLVKPQTFMNSSGQVIPFLQKQGIKPENVLVVHDELEHPFGKITFRMGGSHKGHNGLRSIIQLMGLDFLRLRWGIGRPEHKEDVPEYVLQDFKEPGAEVNQGIEKALSMIESLF